MSDNKENLNLENEAERITVLVVEPGEKPYVKEIESDLKSYQREVDGYIEVIYPFEELVALVCNEEGKVNGLQPNRALRDGDGRPYDIIAGTFLIVGLTEDDFGSLNEEQIRQFSEHFKTPEAFIQLDGKLIIVPMESKEDLPDKAWKPTSERENPKSRDQDMER